MNAIDLNGTSAQISLTHIKATPIDKRRALIAGIILAIIFFLSVPFAKLYLIPIPAFITAYESALLFTDTITAILLISQYWQLRLPVLLVLASAYLFDAAIVIPHALSFPGLISPTGIFNSGPQTTAWIYMFWHGFFPMLLFLYIWMHKHAPNPIAYNRRLLYFLMAFGSVIVAATLFTFCAVEAETFLPAIMNGGKYTPQYPFVVGGVWLLSFASFVMLLVKRRSYSVVDLWLIVVMFTWMIDISLSAGLNSGRYDLGFYLGRFYGLLAATIVLIIILLESNGFLDIVSVMNQRIFDTTLDLILVVDSYGNFIRVSPSCYQILGYSRLEMAGHSALEFIVKDDIEFTRNEMHLARHNKQTRKFECRYQHKKGYPVTLWWTGVWSDPEHQYFFIGRDMTDRIQQERNLRESEARLSLAAEVAEIGLITANSTTEIAQTDTRFNSIYGLSQDVKEINMDDWLNLIHPDDRNRVEDGSLKAIFNGETFRSEYRIKRRPNNELRWVNSVTRIVREKNGKLGRFIGVHIDITEKRHIEDQLRQSQKMEAIGNLTGGMAHDFNNILGVIMGCLDTALVQTKGEVADLLTDAMDAASSAANLTKSLLAFARQQPLKPQKIQINSLINNFVRLLRRTLGENIEIILNLDDNLWPCIVDPVQLESALANLATNARDAMPNGGRLIITTINRNLDTDYAVMNEVTPGDYTAIEVSDTGMGMSSNIVQHIFEPFFTTKDLGETGNGTGLGLAMVFGFIKQSDGHVSVYSEPGIGTTFRLYFPRVIVKEEDIMPEIAPVRTIVRGNGEIILVVEDNDRLRRVVLTQIKNLGYTPIESDCPAAALEILHSSTKIDVLFSDIVMPGEIDGIGLAKRALQLWPDMRILLTSGFPGGIKLDEELENNTVQLLSKPYRTDELAYMLQTVIASPPHSSKVMSKYKHDGEV